MNFTYTHDPSKKYKYIALSIVGLLLAVFLIGNIYNTLIKSGVKVDKTSYYMKSGYPIFTSEKDYIELVRSYMRDPGVKISIHTISEHETIWSVCARFNTDVDTVIAANPFLTNLNLKKGMQIAIPHEKGVLFAFNDFTDVGRMSDKLEYTGVVRGEYKPWILKLISNDDIRFVFFKDKKPLLFNEKIEKLYAFHSLFQQPVPGRYTSLFGGRINPVFHSVGFHDGIDIQAPFGTPIKPARKGIVSYSDWRDGYGKTIMIMHEDGYITLYAHCSKLVAQRGDIVTKENVIAYVGSTGISTGPHLHFSIIHHGKYVNPMLLLW